MPDHAFLEKWTTHLQDTVDRFYRGIQYFDALPREVADPFALIRAQERQLGYLLAKLNDLRYYDTVAARHQLRNAQEIHDRIVSLFKDAHAYLMTSAPRMARLFHAGFARFVRSYECYAIGSQQPGYDLRGFVETGLIPLETMHIINKRDIIEGHLCGRQLLPSLPAPDAAYVRRVVATDAQMQTLLTAQWRLDPLPQYTPDELIWYHPRSHWWWWVTTGEG